MNVGKSITVATAGDKPDCAPLGLLGCPFCGVLPEYEPWAQGHAPGYAWPHQIVHNCKIIGQQICVRAHNDGLTDTKESVFQIWNTRAIGHPNAGDEQRQP